MVGDGDDGERGRMGMGTNTRPHAALYYVSHEPDEQGWNCRGLGVELPPVHVYGHSFLSENRP